MVLDIKTNQIGSVSKELLGANFISTDSCLLKISAVVTLATHQLIDSNTHQLSSSIAPLGRFLYYFTANFFLRHYRLF
jgi:hypothetical protein